MTVKIAFGHKARSGKDVSSDYLLNKYGGQSVRFASIIYKMAEDCYELAGIPYEKDAKLLQFIGTHFREMHGADIWVTAALKEVSNLNKTLLNNQVITAPDCRFRNEANALKSRGFTLVKINRPDKNKGDIGRDPNHISEIDLDNYEKWDYVVENNGTLDELYTKIDSIYNETRGANSRS